MVSTAANTSRRPLAPESLVTLRDRPSIPAILAQVRAQGAASAEELSRSLRVSVETVRRDLRGLRDQGLLNRVHGGATRPSRQSGEGSFAARSTLNLARKQAIAALGRVP
jgi:DeoR/GlpR family transcriptional regulator of sugar metabolism